MPKTPTTFYIVLIATVMLTGATGCSKKGVQSAGDQTSQPGTAQSGGSGTSSSSKSGVGSFPDTSMQSGSGGLKGLDKNPSEERVGAGEERLGGGSGAGSGTMLAKADPSGSAGRQMDEIRAEQAASSAAGLRDVYFGYDSWTISEEGRQALGRDAEWMKSNPSTMIKVEGHCDERGTAAYNLVLGEKRAKAIRNYLVELGVGANRLSVVSYGKERPFCNEHAESCYQQNRRGHLVVRTGK
ncbi:MAG: peptidoglycan-associated lipoprotein Pal [Nitrospira sp. CR1.3]|nr:peptidoglycan-associated lipoprotein Pal [Nitrospira sp. CR1.3]